MTAARGFVDPVFQSQAAFRALAAAMAEPARPVGLALGLSPPAPLFATTAAVLLTLADFETTVWLDPNRADTAAVREWLRFNTGARLASAPEAASFAVIVDPCACPPFHRFAQGTPDYPDRSTTLILQVDAIGGTGRRLSGPGIDGDIGFDAAPLPDGFWASVADNRALFPLGIDIILCGPEAVAALPRAVRPLGEG